MAEKKSYYAIIPANVRYDKDITPNAKLLYGEITALCNEKGYCWAENKYFAELYSVSKTSISKWIKDLSDKGYINTKLIYKDGSKEILNRYITIVKYPIKEKLNTPLTKVKYPIKEKLKDNNTFNNTNNITVNKRKIDYQLIADMYNDTCVSFPRITTLSDSRKKAIKARLNIFSVEDFQTVFAKAEASDFLKGENDRNWTATFDWIIKDSNFVKIKDGNYDNRAKIKPLNQKPKQSTYQDQMDVLKRMYDEAEETL